MIKIAPVAYKLPDNSLLAAEHSYEEVFECVLRIETRLYIDNRFVGSMLGYHGKLADLRLADEDCGAFPTGCLYTAKSSMTKRRIPRSTKRYASSGRWSGRYAQTGEPVTLWRLREIPKGQRSCGGKLPKKTSSLRNTATVRGLHIGRTGQEPTDIRTGAE